MRTLGCEAIPLPMIDSGGRVLRRIASPDEANKTQHNREDEQDVNETAHGVLGGQAEQPQQEQHDGGDSGHGESLRDSRSN